MARTKIAVEIELTEINCGECGGTYAINERYRQQKEDLSGHWTCPYCKTGWGYGKGSLEKAREALEAEKNRHTSTLARLNEAVAARAKSEKEKTRLKKRAEAGSCPCCSRNFQQLARHMKTKHPDYSQTA